MVTWNNLDTVKAYENLKKVTPVKLAAVMAGENGAERVRKYSVPMAAGMAYSYAAKQVDEDVLAALAALAEEMQLVEKFEALYNGEVINTGEKRMVLHHMIRCYRTLREKTVLRRDRRDCKCKNQGCSRGRTYRNRLRW